VVFLFLAATPGAYGWSNPPLRFVALSIASIVCMAGIVSIANTMGLAIPQPQVHHVTPFLGGITASFFVKWEPFRRFAVTNVSSFISLGCIVMAVVSYPTRYSVACLFLLSVAFVLIACGNTLFGALVSPVSRTLGEMAYSVYLLHGIALFVTFYFIIGITESRSLSPLLHWLLIVGVTPALIFGSFVTFRLIEKPAMRNSATVTKWLRTRLSIRSNGRVASGLPLN